MPQMDDDDAINNMLRNPFTSIFGEKKEVKLTSTPQSVKVLPLPQANRPADFGGAVGEFEAESSVTPNKVNVGDPATLKLKISGVGNFDRVASVMLPSDANWKTYSPKSHFEPLDSAGFQGTKTFEQPIIANNGSITSVPSLSFSYFDPEKRQYATLTTAPDSDQRKWLGSGGDASCAGVESVRGDDQSRARARWHRWSRPTCG